MGNEQNEKTEEATPKRREKERNKGNIAKSQDFTSSLILILGVSLVFVMGNSMLETIQDMLIFTFSGLKPDNIPDDNPYSTFSPYFYAYIKIVALFFFYLFIGAAIIMRIQTGNLFAKEALRPKFNKLSPASAFKALIEKLNIFKPKQMVEFIKSMLKMLIVGMVGAKVILKRKDELFSLIGADPSVGFVVMGSVIFELLMTICVLLLIIGIIDKKYQLYY